MIGDRKRGEGQAFPWANPLSPSASVEHLRSLAHQRLRRTERLSLQAVLALAKAIEAKDSYTNGHSERVALYSQEIARLAGFSARERDEIALMALLHDVGKIGVPSAILNKTSRLTAEEAAIVRSHSEIGAEILRELSDMPLLWQGARWHHERCDGKGYPDGISAGQIPVQVRIISVADAYDAMTSRRSYSGTLSQAAVRAEIIRGKGTQFDPQFAAIMLQLMAEDESYQMREGGDWHEINFQEKKGGGAGAPDQG